MVERLPDRLTTIQAAVVPFLKMKNAVAASLLAPLPDVYQCKFFCHGWFTVQRKWAERSQRPPSIDLQFRFEGPAPPRFCPLFLKDIERQSSHLEEVSIGDHRNSNTLNRISINEILPVAARTVVWCHGWEGNGERGKKIDAAKPKSPQKPPHTPSFCWENVSNLPSNLA